MTTASSGPSEALDKKLRPYVTNIERIKGEIDKLTGEHMARCKGKRELIKDAYSQAKDAGLLVRPLKALVKAREWQRKMDALGNEFDLDEQATFKSFAQGSLGPLGIAAALRAGYSADEDVRQEAEKKRDGDISKLGRGPVDQNADAPKTH